MQMRLYVTQWPILLSDLSRPCSSQPPEFPVRSQLMQSELIMPLALFFALTPQHPPHGEPLVIRRRDNSPHRHLIPICPVLWPPVSVHVGRTAAQADLEIKAHRHPTQTQSVTVRRLESPAYAPFLPPVPVLVLIAADVIPHISSRIRGWNYTCFFVLLYSVIATGA